MPSTDTKISEIFIPGPAGRLEAKYFKSKKNTSPIALVLHPHPQYGGTMNNKVVVDIFQTFVDNNFSVCRVNFRGVGKSDGEFDNGQGELADAAAALDWLERENFDNEIEIILCGGGRKNITLVNHIKKLLKFKIKLIDEFSIDGDFIESQAFAYLSIRSYLNKIISYPTTTNVLNPVTGGEIKINY